MNYRSFFAKPLARYLISKTIRDHKKPIECQQNIFEYLINTAKSTHFGKDHHFDKIKSIDDFQKAVPIKDYENIKPYIEQIIDGTENVLWPGLPIYFAKTSGTTSGSKFIPITKASIPNHINTARNALMSYVYYTGNAQFLDGNMMFLSGSPVLDDRSLISTGRLSGIVNHHIPNVLKTNQLPSWGTNCLEDWESKIKKIVEETSHRDLRLISGIPPWVQMYLDKINEHTGKPVNEVFPNLQLFVHGGVNFTPYKKKLETSFNQPIDTLETFPASEGFFAYQEKPNVGGLLLNINSGIFFEFIPLEEFYNDKPTRLTVADVELDKNYALVISNNAGLWAYSIGDTIKFVNKNPLRLVVSGRVKHFISAFGEHVIGEEVDKAISEAAKQFNTTINEFTVAPMVNPTNELPYHEWCIEFQTPPQSIEKFALCINEQLQQQNSYYKDLIVGKVLQPLKITAIKRGGFNQYMESIGKLGGQNKLPRLTNNRKLVEAILEL